MAGNIGEDLQQLPVIQIFDFAPKKMSVARSAVASPSSPVDQLRHRFGQTTLAFSLVRLFGSRLVEGFNFLVVQFGQNRRHLPASSSATLIQYW